MGMTSCGSTRTRLCAGSPAGSMRGGRNLGNYVRCGRPLRSRTRINLNFTVTNPSNSLEFCTYRQGEPNMDVAYIRIR
jgi:hypothetical protein